MGLNIHLLLGLLLLLSAVTPIRSSDYDFLDHLDDEEAPPAPANDEEKDVLLIHGPKSFRQLVDSHRFVLAQFYAPWCGYCKALAPSYAEAATRLKADSKEDVVLVKVDATTQKELAAQYEAASYPTLKWFVNGEVSDYTGPRDVDGIVAWVQAQTALRVTHLDSVEQLAELEARTQLLVLAYPAHPQDASMDALRAVSYKFDDVLFVETSSSVVAAQAGLTTHGIVAIKTAPGHARETVVFTSSPSTEALRSWVASEKLPLLVEYNQDNAAVIRASGIHKQVLVWAPASELAAGSPLHSTILAAAAKFRRQVVFVSVDSAGPASELVGSVFGIATQETKVLGYNVHTETKYMMPGPLSAAALDTFATSLLDGSAPEHYKSQPLPENPTDEDVAIVVGTSVDAIVMDPEKDVLLYVYAPWCTHCEHVNAVVKKVAKVLKQVDSVVVAKMDGTENEHPMLNVDAYPTIFLKPAGKGSRIRKYKEQEKTVKELVLYIKEYATIPFTLTPNKGTKEQGLKDEL